MGQFKYIQIKERPRGVHTKINPYLYHFQANLISCQRPFKSHLCRKNWNHELF